LSNREYESLSNFIYLIYVFPPDVLVIYQNETADAGCVRFSFEGKEGFFNRSSKWW